MLPLEHLGVAQQLGERKQHGALDRIRRTLRSGIECANGFDRVAQQLDAHGLRRLGRKHVDDAAADGVLPRHLAGHVLLVARCGEKADEIFVSNGFVALDHSRQPGIERPLAHPPERRLDRARSIRRPRPSPGARAPPRDPRKSPRAESDFRRAAHRAPEDARRDAPAFR